MGPFQFYSSPDNYSKGYFRQCTNVPFSHKNTNEEIKNYIAYNCYFTFNLPNVVTSLTTMICSVADLVYQHNTQLG